MLGIILFAIGVMYTPGPVNILSLNRGLQDRLFAHLPFCMGVSHALFVWFLGVGYAGDFLVGASFVDSAMLPALGAVGVAFISYLAYKVATASVKDVADSDSKALLGYRDGFFMQLFNPKALMVVLPVTTVQYPAVGIHGIWIAVWALGLSLLAFGAPAGYALVGNVVGSRVKNAGFLKLVNTIMAVLLAAVAADMAWEFVLPAFWP